MNRLPAFALSLCQYGINAKDILSVVWHKCHSMSTNWLSEREVKKRFGDRMREIRNKRKMSQEAVALEIGMDLTSINEIERGWRSPKLITIYKISQALGVKMSDLTNF